MAQICWSACRKLLDAWEARAWALRPCLRQDLAAGFVSACSLRHPLAHGIIEIFALQRRGSVPLMIESSICSINHQCCPGLQFLGVYQKVRARERVYVDVPGSI